MTQAWINIDPAVQSDSLALAVRNVNRFCQDLCLLADPYLDAATITSPWVDCLTGVFAGGIRARFLQGKDVVVDMYTITGLYRESILVPVHHRRWKATQHQAFNLDIPGALQLFRYLDDVLQSGCYAGDGQVPGVGGRVGDGGLCVRYTRVRT